ncbi:beta-ketoacyl-[acyl-carrier-protein] synthase family protein, partial [bacterium]|nr:beta-ketoacyl-[acyl-carrier-protein] synthase family protein [bacterium]
MINNRRVVITGMATINPLGDNLEDYYSNLISGKSGIKKWSSLDMSNVECKIGGDLGGYDYKSALEKLGPELPPDLFKKIRKIFRNATFSNKINVLCTLQAYLAAGLLEIKSDPFRTSILVGGHNFNSRYITKNAEQFQTEPLYIEPLFGVEALDPN